MRKPENQIHNVQQLIEYCKIHNNAQVYVDNDQIGLWDTDNEDIWMDIHPNVFIGEMLAHHNIKWDYV